MKRNKTDLQWNSETELDRLASSQSLDDAEKFMRYMIVEADALDSDGKVAMLTEWEDYYRNRRAEDAALKRERREREKEPDARESSTYRKYPKDHEALALLETAAKKLAIIRKKSPNATREEAIRAVLEEPDEGETKEQKDQRLKRQYRVWYGALKNGKRKNATTTPPDHLDAQTRKKRWCKIFSQWAKYLSEYENHPPAE